MEKTVRKRRRLTPEEKYQRIPEALSGPTNQDHMVR